MNDLLDNLNNINNQILASVDDRQLKIIREEIINKIDYQCQILRTNVDPNQFNDLIRKYLTIQQNYYQIEKNLLTTQELMYGQETYNYVSARHKKVLKLEKDIEQIKELFICMYALVEEQGHKIDKIETHVSQAKDDCNDAKSEFVEAVKYKRKSKKWYKLKF